VPAMDAAGQEVQQRALADPCLAAQDQHPTLTVSHTLDQSLDGPAFTPPPDERGFRIGIRHRHRGGFDATADRVPRAENGWTVLIGGCLVAASSKWIDQTGFRRSRRAPCVRRDSISARILTPVCMVGADAIASCCRPRGVILSGSRSDVHGQVSNDQWRHGRRSQRSRRGDQLAKARLAAVIPTSDRRRRGHRRAPSPIPCRPQQPAMPSRPGRRRG
jgi:hypothetical protein